MHQCRGSKILTEVLIDRLIMQKSREIQLTMVDGGQEYKDPRKKYRRRKWVIL